MGGLGTLVDKQIQQAKQDMDESSANTTLLVDRRCPNFGGVGNTSGISSHCLSQHAHKFGYPSQPSEKYATCSTTVSICGASLRFGGQCGRDVTTQTNNLSQFVQAPTQGMDFLTKEFGSLGRKYCRHSQVEYESTSSTSTNHEGCNMGSPSKHQAQLEQSTMLGDIYKGY